MTTQPSVHAPSSIDRRAIAATLTRSILVLLAASAPLTAQLDTAGSQILEQVADAVLEGPEAGDQFGKALATGDFNGDGRDDLAVGAPYEDFAPISNRGSVSIYYAGVDGLDPNDAVIWDLDNLAGETPSTDDELGKALAAGDFDGDGFDDLAIGIPGRYVVLAGGGIADAAGAVMVLYGSVGGLNNAGIGYFHQESNLVEGVAEADDRFGAALAAGDFDADGFDDLAIGVPLEDAGAISNAGAVNVLYGAAVGLSGAGDQIWTQESITVGGDEAGDDFGAALAAGDFDGDGYDDLAIGAPYEDWIGIADAGSVFQLVGGPGGLTTGSGAPFVVQETIAADASEANDWFGRSLAAGDLDGDGIDDLLVGSPGEGLVLEIGAFPELGQVQVLFGVAGLGADPDTAITLNRFHLAGALETGDQLGTAVAIGNFDGGVGLDLAVGAPWVEVGALDDVGEAYVAYGPTFAPPASLGIAGQDGPLPGVAEAGDRFGEALAVGDFDGNGFDDLAVGVPYEDVGALADAGAVNVLYSAGIFRDGFEEGDAAAWSDFTGGGGAAPTG